MRKIIPFVCLLLSSIQLFAKEKLFPPPTTPASNIFFNLLDGGDFRVNWTNGNGARRIVVMRQGAAVTGVPVDGVDYNPGSAFGSGDILNAGEFIVYDNTSNFVDVTNLQPNTTYHVTVFEYNGSASTTEYLVAGAPVGSQSTLTAPTTQASAVLFTNQNGNSVTINWTSGNGGNRVVIMRAGGAVNFNPVNFTSYTPNATFGNGTPLSVDNYVVYNSAGSTVNITGLQPNTTYHVAVFEYNGSGTPVYLVAGAATANFTTPARPTTAASGMFFNIPDGGSFRVNWVNGNGTRRIVIARAGSPVDAVPADGVDYAENLNFNLGQEVLPGQRVIYDNTSNFVDLVGLTPATTYHFRVYEYSGTGANIGYLTASFASGSQATLSAPTTQASNLSFSNISPNSVTLTWTNGNGNRRVILAKAGSPVDFDPVDLTNYGPSQSFGSGTQLGTGNYCVFNQTTGNSVVVTNLTPGLTYYFSIFEANGDNRPVFLRPGLTGNVTTSTRPTIPASGTFFNIIDGGDMRFNWVNGNGSRRIVIARAGSAVDAIPVDGVDYAANVNFNLAPEISPGQRIVYDNTNSFADVAGLLPSTTYHFRVYEYSGTGATIQYLTSSFASASQATLSPPTTQASNVIFSAVGSNTMTVSWTNGNGNGRIVLMKAGSPVDAAPVGGTSYGANPSFGNGPQIGTDNYVIFRANSGSSVNVTGLTPGVTYHVAVFEFNGSSTGAYNTTAPAIGSQATSGTPTIPASGVFFNIIEGDGIRVNWANGNGPRRIVVARAGSPVDAIPVNGVDYAANVDFNLAPEISPGQRVVYDNNGTFVDVDGLQPNTVYHFRIYEYAGTGAATQYLTSAFGSGSQSTITAPTIQSSNVTFTSVTGNAFTINWTNGNGEARMVVIRQGGAVNAIPQHLINYSASGTFGSGTQLGTGNYTLFRGTGSNVPVTGLTSGTTYHVAVFEYNGSSGPVFNQVVTAIGNATTIGAPQVAANALGAGGLAARSMQLTWNNGSGQRRLVLMRQGAAVNVTPVNDVNYTANSFFGSGSEIGTGNFAVFNGTASNVTVTNLLPNTTYHFAVFEFNSFGASVLYLTANAPTGNATTTANLPVTFTEFQGAETGNGIKLNWTTAQEQNSAYFEVQRSTNGAVFVAIGNISAAGNSDNPLHYQFTDSDPLDGVSYYRLRQVDKDGQFGYSKTLTIRYEVKSAIRKVVNPFSNAIFIQFTAGTVQTGTPWKLYDMQGRLVLSRVTRGNIINEPAGMLKPGVYLFEIMIRGKRQVMKLIRTE
jgi:hypothetical protein